MKKTLSTLLATLARLFCLLGLTFAAAATHAATLSVSPTNVVAGGTVTATWSGIATPTTTDWLALATPGMANTTYISWRYTTGTASGSVPFSIPSVASGTYELRLFANNGFTRLATSNPFTVGTQTVSGTVTVGGSPLAGVAFAATNGGVCASSNASGQYSCTVAYGWSGSVTPSSSGHTFTPASRSYANVVANQTAQDYTAVILYVVSGTVTAGGSPLAAVAFAASNGGTCTSSDASGQYSCTVVQGWSGSVTPSAGGYTFTPASRSYSNVSAGQSAQDFAAQPVAITAAIFYIHPDHLNTPRLIADSAGTTVWRWDQGEPFGNDVPNNNPSGAGAFDFPLRFPGQYFDRELNANYNIFRDFDPGIGRYLQSDPIGLAAGLNTYLYVKASPIRYADPFGLMADCGPADGWQGYVVPNNPLGFPFQPCCDSHDKCYDNCKGPDKLGCDMALGNCLFDKCKTYTGYVQAACRRAAQEYSYRVLDSDKALEQFIKARAKCKGPNKGPDC